MVRYDDGSDDDDAGSAAPASAFSSTARSVSGTKRPSQWWPLSDTHCRCSLMPSPMWASAAPRHHLRSLGPHLPPEWRHRRSQNCTHRPRNAHHPRRSAGHVLHRGTGRISSLPVRSHRSHRHWGEGTRPRATRRGSARRSQRVPAHSSAFPLNDSLANLNTDATFPSGPGR